MKKTILASALLLLVACNSKPAPVPVPAPQPVVQKTFSTGLVKKAGWDYGVGYFSPKIMQGVIPESFDWEEQGFVTPVRNQGQCGSCWAFAGTQRLEMNALIFLNKKVDLSEQQLVSCMTEYDGCSGGFTTGQWQVQNGQTDEASFPYTTSDSRCKAGLQAVVKPVQWGMVGAHGRSASDTELQQTIMTYGVIDVTVGADNQFMNLSGEPGNACPHTGTNHMVALVGWKTVNGKVYYKVKNSWGLQFGKQGYAYVARGCWNLAEDAEWSAYDTAPCVPPTSRLPKSVTLEVNSTVRLSVKPEPNTTYEWEENAVKVSSEAYVDYTAHADSELMLKAHNHCGDLQAKTQIVVR